MKLAALSKKDIGRTVIFNHHSPVSLPIEFGKITSYNSTYIFVRYGSDLHSKATSPDNLEFEIT